MGNFSSHACTDQNFCGIGNCGKDLAFRTSKLAPCIAELRFHPPSAELELNLSRPPCAPRAPPVRPRCAPGQVFLFSSETTFVVWSQSPPILLLPYSNTDFYAAMKPYFRALQSPSILLPPYFNTGFSAAMEPYLRALKGRVTWRRGDEIWGEKWNRKLKGVLMSLFRWHTFRSYQRQCSKGDTRAMWWGLGSFGTRQGWIVIIALLFS